MNSFAIQSPWMLGLLVLVPIIGLLQLRARRLRRRVVAQMSGGAAMAAAGRDGLRLTALLLMILALSRPGYSPERRSVSQSGRDVVFAIDVSRSMLAQDAMPSRLEAAKQGVRDALDSFRTERAGLVIYAGSATILCPLTQDYDFVRYMLDQASPRSVDFGGSTMLSAVEKSVDNLFTEGRGGMQDLVVLSDGDDHGPEMERVASLLQEAKVDLLLVGLGDPAVGSRIPISDGEGGVVYLKHEEDFVTSKLEEQTFEELVDQLPGASYLRVGTAPYDGAAVYAGHVEGKPVEGAVGGDSFVVYREAGLPLMAVALFLLLMGEWLGGRSGGATGALVGLLATGIPGGAEAADPEIAFEEARAEQQAGRFSEALELYAGWGGSGSAPEQLAALRFNQGLCHLALADSVAAESPSGALSSARSAQRCLLEAIRMNPELERAGQRLDSTSRRIEKLQAEVDKREEEERESEEQLASLVELLEKLRDEQQALYSKLRAEVPNLRNRKKGPDQAPAKDAEPALVAQSLVDRQTALAGDGRMIHGAMEALDKSMAGPANDDGPPPESILKEPLRLMAGVVVDQDTAVEKLSSRQTWELAAAEQQQAIRGIEEILELLAGDSSESSEEGEDYEEDWDMGDYEEGEEGDSSSMPMSGDLAAGSEMQALPVPNYSVEEMLMEERGNMQFRQQQRAKANEGKVEKDW